MAVTSRDLRNERRPAVSIPRGNVGSIAYIVTGILAMLAAYVLLSSVIGWGRTLIDDMRYGRPRTFHLTENVGRPEEASAPTHLIAMNLDRQVVILEIPGGDATKTRALPGPYLFGAGEDLTPVTMRLTDVNSDGAPDLIVRVKDEEMVYANRDGSFNLITAEERQQLMQQGMGGQ
ncbi:hypothetical protein K2Z83_17790 [Oscillochloris sp. ZM17-4]|uniref:hypothetical protein n=1 Tax=Oscillochloris sp. ZM17-4 TaxID=2866714 RepID=UPI001C7361EA|nr:hypothetical protein [Oscillochloris sp. ZM17-4]MBX0329526.1 hypothetical protein [Oscillochloris sp. ZM17-4]